MSLLGMVFPFMGSDVPGCFVRPAPGGAFVPGVVCGVCLGCAISR